MLKRLLGGGLLAMVIKLIAAALSLVMFAGLSRTLGPHAYGEYAQVFSLATFLSFVIAAGLGVDVLRKLPSAKRDDERNEYFSSAVRALVLTSAVIGLLCSLAGAIGFVAGHAFWGRAAILAFILAVALAGAEFLAGALRAVGMVGLALLPRDVFWRVLLVAFLVGLAVFGLGLGSSGALLASAVCLAIVLAVQVQIGRKRLPRLQSHDADSIRPTQVLWRARWLAFSTVAWNLLQPLSVLVVGSVLATYDAGIYFTAQKTATLVGLPLIALNMVGAPLIARAWAEGDLPAVRRICVSTSCAASGTTLAGVLLLALVSGDVLSIFDETYASAGSVLVILSCASLVNAIAGPAAVLLQMTGHERQLLAFVAIGQGLGLVLVAVGGALWGLPGAAVGFLFGTLVLNVLVVVWSRKTISVDPSVFATIGVWRARRS